MTTRARGLCPICLTLAPIRQDGTIGDHLRLTYAPVSVLDRRIPASVECSGGGRAPKTRRPPRKPAR